MAYLRTANLHNRRTSYDTTYQLDDGATASYTASGVAQVGGSDGSADFGTDAESYPLANLVLQITSVDDTTDDETYTFKIEQSASSSFATLTDDIEVTIDNGTANGTTAMHRFQVVQRYIRLTYTLGGTTPILVVDNAYLTSGE